MNIILLSGGSGKRLWPLSNEVRSKQFLKLFKDNYGNYESMVQRVYRQISTVDSEAKIIIATSETQISAIHNQLGEKVTICVEPSRRDTFPAISLAASQLFYEQGIDRDECIIVCPVDSYVDDSYYKAMVSLEEQVNKDIANIVLMGIEPTYPSDKYGYIIPENKEKISKVKEYREKPDVETADYFIKRGALWNAGVFACKLGYLVDKAHELVDFTDYHDLYKKYDSMTKISFDYAVAEKEKSIEVMRYNGEWRDVGTWNMLVDVLEDKTKGNVTLDSTCVNSEVINELDIPVLCMGIKDMVVAVSGDGILISNKHKNGLMKTYVDRISTDIHYAEKSWGTYTVLHKQSGYLTVKVALQAGSRMKYHSHEMRNEVWIVVAGFGLAVIDGNIHNVQPGDTVSVVAGCVHTIIANTDMDIIEVQVGEKILQEDKQIFSLEMDFTKYKA